MEQARFLVAQARNPQAGLDVLVDHGLLVLPSNHVRVGEWPDVAIPGVGQNR